MGNRPAALPGRATHELRHALHEADDQKIRRITAMLDDVVDPEGKQAILDPLRDRLGSLKPLRPLRFARLLFTPLGPLIVPANAWRPGDAAVPRTVLTPMSVVVRDSLGAQAAAIDKAIAGHKTDAAEVIATAGEALWPRAAEILAMSSAPADWEQTGLRSTFYPALAGTIATVLRRAMLLLCLSRDEAMGALAAEPRTIKAIFQSIGEESPEGCAMVVALILLQAPRAVPVLRQYVSSVLDPAEKAMLQRALARGLDQAVTRLESPSGIMGEIARAPLALVVEDVRRFTSFLLEMGDDASAAAHRPRLKAIREKLDQACRDRFADGLEEGLVQPLATAPGAIDGASQTRMEASARNLRSLEMAARKLGGGGDYDRLLQQATETVRVAAKSGTLTPVRTFRLVEVLAGSDAAAAMYRQAHAKS